MRGTHDPAVLERIEAGYARATKGWARCACGRWKPCAHCRQDARSMWPQIVLRAVDHEPKPRTRARLKDLLRRAKPLLEAARRKRKRFLLPGAARVPA